MATTSSQNTLKDTLIYLKKKLERSSDDETILRIIHKLSKIPITMELLQGTGAGKIVRVLAKKPGNIGSKASSLLNRWRDIVAQKSSETSSLKENDHPKILSPHTSSKVDNKSEKVSKNVSEEKNVKDKHSKKERHIKERHYEKKHSPENSKKNPLEIFSKEHKHSKEKHSLKRLPDEQLEQDKKKHKEKYKNVEHNLDSKCFINRNGENSLNKKNIDKNKSNYISKHEKLSSRQASSFLPVDDSNESTIFRSESFLGNEHELADFNDSENPLNSDSFISHEPSPKKTKNDSSKHNSEHKVKSSQFSTHLNLSKEEKIDRGVDLDLFQKKRRERDEESNVKKDSGEKSKKDKISNKSKVKNSNKKDLKMLSTEEFTSSEALFEDCLNFNDIVPVKKKKSSKPVSNSLSSNYVSEISNKFEKKSTKIKTSKSCPSPVSTEVEKDELKLSIESMDEEMSPEKKVDIASTLPQTQPNYRPLPQRNYDYSPIKKRENMSNEDAIKFTSSRKEKTAVYSGRKNKTNYLTAVPTLFECCTRVLIENIDDIEYMGVIPFFLLESMLQRCTPSQLYRIEDFNPYLLDDTNELWEIHCKRDFRTAKPQENETWRELYWRSHDEREQRLRNVTANISALIANSNPSRKAKLAYVDSVVKPPRDVARRQAKNGTALPTNHTVKSGPPSKASPRPSAPSINAANSAASTCRPRIETKPIKPKIAPLMAKTLKSMKKCFRR